MKQFVIQGLKRGGSMPTSLHTPLRLAVKLRILLWQIDGKPPQGQLRPG